MRLLLQSAVTDLFGPTHAPSAKDWPRSSVLRQLSTSIKFRVLAEPGIHIVVFRPASIPMSSLFRSPAKSNDNLREGPRIKLDVRTYQTA
ncbi:hypothetical protein IE81DRAFT_106988 [Ceraceosorus guamensis]|uniref:Uncharacterized protein n=1 Tax=Ceraceosorus guamensis TaxID=1522189 RepID=A0A316W2E8_9BASI|nr:hypothetical protein IE81DRAFT_106988 [Ceraceosorus guamensis]PWN42953.1 hypothetical protein IE81DRAFT_106988 [Ceraceosorus guamensis]